MVDLGNALISRWPMSIHRRLGFCVAAFAVAVWLAGVAGLASGQVAPPGFKARLGPQKETPLEGKWRGVAKDGSATYLTIERHDDGLTIDLALTDAKTKQTQAGHAEKVHAIGGFARTDMKLELVRPGTTYKVQMKVEEEKLKLMLVDGIDRRDLVLTRLDAEGKPKAEPITAAESGDADFKEIASFKAGTQLMRYGAAALSPDGKLVAAAAQDIEHQIAIFDVATGQEQRRLD